jgi:hypothetical protein
MTASTVSKPRYSGFKSPLPDCGSQANSLIQGEIVLNTRAHSMFGAGVTAQMYLPMQRDRAWVQVTDYPRWVKFFPDVTESRVLERSPLNLEQNTHKRIYQAASKSFLFITAQVEIYLQVLETTGQRIQFYLESGHFHDFEADLQLQDMAEGCLLTYSVQATPTIPVPGPFIQQAVQWDLPHNMRNMRRVLCNA